MSRTQLAVLACAAAALAVALGSWGIAEASLWLDETFSVHDARRSIADIVAMRNNAAHGGALHPGGYYLVSKGALAICGAHEVCVRMPSVLANAGLAAAIVVLAARLFGRHAAFVAAIVWPTLPYALKYAQQARHYGMLGLATTLALLFAVRALALDGGPRATRRSFVGLGLAAGASVWMHLFAAPFLVGLATFCAGWDFARRRRAPELAPRGSDWALAVAVAGLVAAPLVPGIWEVWMTAGGGQLDSRAGPVENVRQLVEDLFTLGLDSWWIPGLAAFALLPAPWTRRALVVTLLLLAVFPLSVVLVRNPEHFVTLRYFMPSLPVIALLLAAGVAAIVELSLALGERLLPRAGTVVGAAIAVAVLGWPTSVLARLHYAGIAKQYATADFEPWDRIAAAIREHAEDGDLTVVVPYAYMRFPFEFYPLPTEILDPEDEGFSQRLADHRGKVFVVTSHIDRPERSELRRQTLRALGRAGFRRHRLPDIRREAHIELLTYRRR